MRASMNTNTGLQISATMTPAGSEGANALMAISDPRTMTEPMAAEQGISPLQSAPTKMRAI